MIKTRARLHEVVLATQKGIFFANVLRGVHCLRQQDVEKLGSEFQIPIQTSPIQIDQFGNPKSTLAQDHSKPMLSVSNYQENNYNLAIPESQKSRMNKTAMYIDNSLSKFTDGQTERRYGNL